MKLSKLSEQDVTCCIQDIEKKYELYDSYLLFAHAFCRYDTRSSANRLGRIQILGKLSRAHEISYLADKFHNDDTTCNTIGKFYVLFFRNTFFHKMEIYVHIYLNYEKRIITKMISRYRSTIDPSYLLPSSRDACFQGMRVYHQILVRKKLLNNDVIPYTKIGSWEEKNLSKSWEVLL